MIPVCQPANIFQHKSFWQRFPDNSHKLKQQFSPVIIKSFSQTCKTETLARRTAYDQCGLTFLYIGGFKEFFGCYIRNTFVDDGQMRIICPQCITAGRVYLYSNSNVKTITYPGGKDVTYTYDALNRVTSIIDWKNATTTFRYNENGTIDYIQFPNKVRTTYSYDSAGRLTAKSTRRNSGNGTVIAEYTYGLDNLGNHLTETITEPYSGIPVPTEGTTSYTYNNANRITKAGSISFDFDSNGNTTSRTGRTMTYDIVNNLMVVSGDFNATYTYDGLGQRRSATKSFRSERRGL